MTKLPRRRITCRNHLLHKRESTVAQAGTRPWTGIERASKKSSALRVRPSSHASASGGWLLKEGGRRLPQARLREHPQDLPDASRVEETPREGFKRPWPPLI